MTSYEEVALWAAAIRFPWWVEPAADVVGLTLAIGVLVLVCVYPARGSQDPTHTKTSGLRGINRS